MRCYKFLLLFFLAGIQCVIAQGYTDAINNARFLINAHKLQTEIPGVQIAVMAKGKLVWSEGFGYSNLVEQRKVVSTTKFRIASVSKPLTFRS